MSKAIDKLNRDKPPVKVRNSEMGEVFERCIAAALGSSKEPELRHNNPDYASFTIRKMVENSIKMQQAYPKCYQRDFSYLKMSGPRGWGHTQSLIDVFPTFFDKCLFIFPTLRTYTDFIRKHGPQPDLIQLRTANMIDTVSLIKDNRSDCVVLDNTFMFTKNQIIKIDTAMTTRTECSRPFVYMKLQ